MSVASVGDTLQEYAGRGVFRSFSRQETTAKGIYHLQWHRAQHFDLVFDRRRQTLRIACVLPRLPSKSPMYREFKTWLAARQDPALPAHRRCDSTKAGLKLYNRDGEVALTLTCYDGDLVYSVRALIAVVNEIYQDFLHNGPYFEWQVEAFNLDPDHLY
jgi:hypothetical protein